jgi:uncharacterized protein YbjT (DUF2867 family)
MRVLVTGASGYMGVPLCRMLLERGHTVRAPIRPRAERVMQPRVEVRIGNGLDAGDVQAALESQAGSALQHIDTLVHLVGTRHPAPWKAQQFESVDGASLRAGVAAIRANASAHESWPMTHLVFVSVAHPAPAMQAYVAARTRCEEAIRAAGIPATVLRPWYVLGPGHLWPYVLLPIYKLLEAIPATREGAIRLGLVTREQMLGALVYAVEHPINSGVRVVGVDRIRAIASLGEADRNGST